jgi:putative transposase
VERYAAVEKLMADHGFSERRACRLVAVNRSAWQYEPLRGKDQVTGDKMKTAAAQPSPGHSSPSDELIYLAMT